MASKILLIAVGLVFLGGGIAAYFYFSAQPDFSEYDNLRDPQISTIEDQKMIEIELAGDPNEVGGEAFGQLFKTYYAVREGGGTPDAPRARWPISEDTPKDEWVGRYGMPVPESVESVPDAEAGDLEIKLVTWEYGEVAEILHEGSYADEPPTIERLEIFIEEGGYEIVGEHEEEYLKGPGMFFAGNPDKYLTIIRYRIKPVAAE